MSKLVRFDPEEEDMQTLYVLYNDQMKPVRAWTEETLPPGWVAESMMINPYEIPVSERRLQMLRDKTKPTVVDY